MNMARGSREGIKAMLGGPESQRYRALRSVRDTVRSAESAYRRRTGRAATITVGSHVMSVPEDMRWAFRGGDYYERSFARWLERFAQAAPSPVFYDVGANYGYYTLLLADAMAEVQAFEPVTSTHDVLAKTIERNGLRNVTLNKLGLFDTAGEADIRLFSSSGNNSLFDVTAGEDVHRTGVETIQLRTLDALVADGMTPPGLIKMDVEGAELFVLRGGRAVLQEYRPIVTAEFYAPHFEKAGYAPDDLIDELTAAGYVVCGIPEDVDAPSLAELGRKRTGNIVALDPTRDSALLPS